MGFLMAPYITWKWFRFFNGRGFSYIYCLFYFSSIKGFEVVLKYFFWQKNHVRFSYLQIHWAFSWIFRFNFSFITGISWYYLIFSLNVTCSPSFYFTPLFSSVFFSIYFFCILNLHLLCLKLFYLCDITTRQKTTYIIPMKNIRVAFKSLLMCNRLTTYQY